MLSFVDGDGLFFFSSCVIGICFAILDGGVVSSLRLEGLGDWWSGGKCVPSFNGGDVGDCGGDSCGCFFLIGESFFGFFFFEVCCGVDWGSFCGWGEDLLFFFLPLPPMETRRTATPKCELQVPPARTQQDEKSVDAFQLPLAKTIEAWIEKVQNGQ